MRKLLAALCSLGLLIGVAWLSTPTAAAFEGTVNDSGVRVRAAPSTSAATVNTLRDGQVVDIVRSVRGSNVAGGNLWFQLPSGGWVHSSLVSRRSTTTAAPSGGRVATSAAPARGTVTSPPTSSGRWIDVDISSQTTRAMEGSRVVYTAAVTTARSGWLTPRGTFPIKRRAYNTTMDSTSIGLPRNGPGGWYLPNVYFTQYFTDGGHAIHYNYWAPRDVFGNRPTSAGCVGMEYADAQFFWNFATIGTPVTIHD